MRLTGGGATWSTAEVKSRSGGQGGGWGGTHRSSPLSSSLCQTHKERYAVISPRAEKASGGCTNLVWGKCRADHTGDPVRARGAHGRAAPAPLLRAAAGSSQPPVRPLRAHPPSAHSSCTGGGGGACRGNGQKRFRSRWQAPHVQCTIATVISKRTQPDITGSLVTAISSVRGTLLLRQGFAGRPQLHPTGLSALRVVVLPSGGSKWTLYHGDRPVSRAGVASSTCRCSLQPTSVRLPLGSHL